MFYVAATVSLIGALVYVKCSSSALQEWAINSSTITIEVDDTDQALLTNGIDTSNRNIQNIDSNNTNTKYIDSNNTNTNEHRHM